MNELNSKTDTAKDRICKLEDSHDEISQNAAHRETSGYKHKRSQTSSTK